MTNTPILALTLMQERFYGGTTPAPFGAECLYARLPLPPVGQNQSLRVARGRVYDDPRIDEWRRLVFVNHLELPTNGSKFGTQKVVVHLNQYMEKDDHDIDSKLKKLLDILEGYGYKNDKQIVEFAVLRKRVASEYYWHERGVDLLIKPCAEILVETYAQYKARPYLPK